MKRIIAVAVLMFGLAAPVSRLTKTSVMTGGPQEDFVNFDAANASTAVNWKAAIVNSVALSSFFMIFLPRSMSSLPDLSSINYRLAEQTSHLSKNIQ